jgi:hypothetical protein
MGAPSSIDPEDLHWFMAVKFTVSVGLFVFLPTWWMATLALIVLAVGYRHVIALIYGLHVVDVNDLNCFHSNNQLAVCNVMSATPVSKGRTELTKEAFSRIVYSHVKARSGIVHILGDKYYQELDPQTVINSQIEFLPDGYLKT